ncbi:unnamed protein product, partial [Chrysoparadoxa australica]
MHWLLQPLCWVGLLVTVTENLGTYKNIAMSALLTVTGRGGQCRLCDSLMSLVLRFEEDSPEDIDCEAICLWKFDRCMNMCEKVVEALQSSTRYPCVACGMCPELDEYGETTCTYHWKERQCEPVSMCALHWGGKWGVPRPQCKVKPGLQRWVSASKMLRHNTGALAHAIATSPRCGQKGASKLFCVNEPVGLGYLAMVMSYVLVAVVGVWQSIAAIETPGGDDDRQWLSFWVIMFGFFTLERFTDVLLSFIPIYYEMKLLMVLYLIWGRGADLAYRKVHRAFKWVTRESRHACAMYDEAQHLKELEADPTLQHIAKVATDVKGGIHALLSRIQKPSDSEQVLGGSYAALDAAWFRLEPRVVVVRLLSANGLPLAPSGLDHFGQDSCDPYVRLWLSHPSQECLDELIKIHSMPGYHHQHGEGPSSPGSSPKVMRGAATAMRAGQDYNRCRSRACRGTTTP